MPTTVSKRYSELCDVCPHLKSMHGDGGDITHDGCVKGCNCRLIYP